MTARCSTLTPYTQPPAHTADRLQARDFCANETLMGTSPIFSLAVVEDDATRTLLTGHDNGRVRATLIRVPPLTDWQCLRQQGGEKRMIWEGAAGDKSIFDILVADGSILAAGTTVAAQRCVRVTDLQMETGTSYGTD